MKFGIGDFQVMSPSSHEFRERIEETLLYFGKYLNICRVPEYVSGT